MNNRYFMQTQVVGTLLLATRHGFVYFFYTSCIQARCWAFGGRRITERRCCVFAAVSLEGVNTPSSLWDCAG